MGLGPPPISRLQPVKGQSVDKTAIRDAATVILVRDPHANPRVLMGQRGANAAFMPNKFVFPGGALDATDDDVHLVLPEPCATRTAQDNERGVTSALFAAAIRELWEETGLVLGKPGAWRNTPPKDWRGFAEAGFLPSASGLRYVFRAITPPGRPRRFDARFFLADADGIAGDLDDFSRASDELSHLQWIPLPEVRGFTLPFITEVVLAEVAAQLPSIRAGETVPFFDNRNEVSVFRRIA